VQLEVLACLLVCLLSIYSNFKFMIDLIVVRCAASKAFFFFIW